MFLIFEFKFKMYLILDLHRKRSILFRTLNSNMYLILELEFENQTHFEMPEEQVAMALKRTGLPHSTAFEPLKCAHGLEISNLAVMLWQRASVESL